MALQFYEIRNEFTKFAIPFAWVEPTGNLDAVFSVITDPCTLAEALADGETNLVQADETIPSA